MKSVDALKVLAEVTAYQWGLITSAQARALGVKKPEPSRLADSGHIERITHGVYRHSGAPSDPYEELKAAWLSTNPDLTADVRTNRPATGIIVASTSAARHPKIGDFWDDRHEFVSQRRKQSQRPEIRFRTKVLEAADVTLMEGLPTMSIERTLADLLEELGDQSLVAGALKDASRNTIIDRSRQWRKPGLFRAWIATPIWLNITLCAKQSTSESMLN